ncbi:hypothetical protein [Variovorax sp.]|jgi:hypothetical protein|uniref:hypothetical protein n=1 Tax=Variovorax sp. TaxID=1871043 RepID=UPI0037D9E4F3
MDVLPADEVAEKLADLHSKAFGGKTRGRFSMPREDFRELSGRQRLDPVVITDVNAALFQNHNLALVECGKTAIGVIDAGKVIAWRKPPKKFL